MDASSDHAAEDNGKSIGREVADGVVEEILGAVADVALQAITSAGQIAVDCGSAAAEAACSAAGSLLDGL